MTILVIESRDSFDSHQTIYSGVSPVAFVGTRLFAGILDTYIVGIHATNQTYTRIETGFQTYEAISASPPSGDAHGVATHILGEYGLESFGVYVDTDNSPYKIHISSYPEFTNTWQTFSGVNNLPSDVEHPEYLDSLRFLVGYGENVPEKVLVVNVISGIDITSNRYATNWNSPLSSDAIITDLEAVRLI